MLSIGTIVAGVTIVISAAAQGAAAPREQPVRRTAAFHEYRPVVGSGYLAWAQARATRPRHFDVYVRPLADGRATKVNPRGTQGVPGAISGRRLVYERWSLGRRHDIEFFDLRTRRRKRPPPGVNTAASEVAPTLSRNWLAFTRIVRGEQVAFARNLRTGEEVEILRERWARTSQVSGRYVVVRTTDVFRYDLRTRRLERLDSPGIPELSVTAASATPDGTVYVAWQDMDGCDGIRTMLRRFQLDDSGGEEIRRLNALVSSMYAVAGPRTTIYYDRVSCAPRRLPTTADVYRLAVDR